MRQGEQRQNKEKRREGRKKDEQGARGDGRAENRFFATLRMTERGRRQGTGRGRCDGRATGRRQTKTARGDRAVKKEGQTTERRRWR